MKNFKFMAIALVAMFGFTACDNECEHELNKACEHEFIEYDYSKALVGTWTCIEPENEYAEALVINADGSVTSTGVFDGQLWEKKGSIKIKDNKMTLSFEDGDYLETRFEMVEGVAFALVDDELDVRYDYYYCENDLSDEIVGMWVCTYVPWMDADMAINVYKADGKAFFTGFTPDANGYEANVETTYKVIGDLMIQSNPWNWEGAPEYLAFRLDYSPNGSELGDVLTNTNLMVFGDEAIETTASMIRIKQSLNLTGKTYDYSSAYVTNAKGADEDFTMLGHTFNIAKIKAGDFDMFFRSELFCVDLNANSIKQYYRTANGQDIVVEIPITVDGNKVTLDLSAENPAFRKVDMYMYQDADDSQLHMYMHTDAFINYFANLQIFDLISDGKIDLTDAAAVEKVFTDMEARVESINVSFVLKARK